MSKSNYIPAEAVWKQPNYKDVVRDEHTFRENLPLPYVTYPADYGKWLSFQASLEDKPYFCDCQKDAMINFLQMNALRSVCILSRGVSLLNHFLPVELANRSPHITNPNQLYDLNIFHPKLCHKCNLHVPSIRWSNLGEHSIFIQHFGWYWKQRLFEYGINLYGAFLPDHCPPHLRDLIDVDPNDAHTRIWNFTQKHNLNFSFYTPSEAQLYSDPELADIYGVYKILTRIQKQVELSVEAELRKEFGFPNRGTSLNNETLLYLIMRSLFPCDEITRNARPKWLKGLTLDIFIPDRSIACEYQGIQHFKPMKHFGGEKQFAQQKQRDRKKSLLCEKHNVRLIYFDRSDKLTEDFIRNKTN